MALLSENVLLNSTAKGVEKEVLAVRKANILLSHFYSKPSLNSLAGKLAAIKGNNMKIAEYTDVSTLPEQDIISLVNNSAMELEYLDFFDNMSIGKRRILVKKYKERDIFKISC